jgi:hypothetical protein
MKRHDTAALRYRVLSSSSEVVRHQLAVAPIPSARHCDHTCWHIALVSSNFKEARCSVGSVVCESGLLNGMSGHNNIVVHNWLVYWLCLVHDILRHLVCWVQQLVSVPLYSCPISWIPLATHETKDWLKDHCKLFKSKLSQRSQWGRLLSSSCQNRQGQDQDRIVDVVSVLKQNCNVHTTLSIIEQYAGYSKECRHLHKRSD